MTCEGDGRTHWLACPCREESFARLLREKDVEIATLRERLHLAEAEVARLRGYRDEAMAARAYIDCDKKHGDGTEARVLPWLELRVLYDEARAANEEMEK